MMLELVDYFVRLGSLTGALIVSCAMAFNIFSHARSKKSAITVANEMLYSGVVLVSVCLLIAYVVI